MDAQAAPLGAPVIAVERAVGPQAVPVDSARWSPPQASQFAARQQLPATFARSTNRPANSSGWPRRASEVPGSRPKLIPSTPESRSARLRLGPAHLGNR